jgi:hypothetical protein
MTWKEVKQALEAKGLKDADEIQVIDIRCYVDLDDAKLHVDFENDDEGPRIVSVW